MARRTDDSDADALAGARLIARSLPVVLSDGHNLAARTELLKGAMHAGAALRVGFGLAHALSQALGGWTGGSHGGFNALCLAPVLRFNSEVAADSISRLADAMEVADAAAGVERLARLGGFTSLRALGVVETDLREVADAAIVRLGARLNPRVASAAEAEEILRSIY